MTALPVGGPAATTYRITSRAHVVGRVAVPAYLVTDGRAAEGGPSQQVYYVSDAEIASGEFVVAGDVHPIPIVAVNNVNAEYPPIPIRILNLSDTEIVTAPDTAFSWLPFSIFRDGRTFTPANSWDVSSLSPSGATPPTSGTGVYYVDGVAGTAGGAGDSAHPLKSIAAACAKADATTIYIKGGIVYDRSIGFGGGLLTKNLGIYPWPSTGTPICTDHAVLTWVQDGTLTHTYKATRSATWAVLDTRSTDANGDYTALTRVADAATVEATPGSWTIDGSNVVWIRLSDDTAPATATTWALVDNQLFFRANITVYAEGLKMVGNPISVGNGGAGQSPKFYGKNLTLSYSASGIGGVVSVLGCSEVILQDCTVSRSIQDGCNYTALNSVVPNVCEIRCVGRDNGTVDGTANDNGSSAHNASIVTRIMGEYARNVGPNIVDIDASKTWCLGCNSHDSASDVGANDINYMITGTMWLDRVTSSGSAVDLNSQAGSTIYTRQIISGGNNTGAGAITTY